MYVPTNIWTTTTQQQPPVSRPLYRSTCVSRHLQLRTVLFFSRPRSEGWPHHGRTFSIYLCPLSFWLTLPRAVLSTSSCCPSRPCVVFLARDIVPCIIFFSRQLPCFLMVWPYYASFLALTVSNSSLFTPAMLRIHSFIFFAVHKIRRIFLSPFISKAHYKA